MNTLLLPYRYKRLGWILLVLSITLFIISLVNRDLINWTAPIYAISSDELLGEHEWFVWKNTEIAETLMGVLFIIGGLLVSFSKEPIEDEFIEKLRLSSWMWAVGVNYLLLLFAFVFVYGSSFLNVMIYGMFTVLIIFILRFNFILLKSKRQSQHEK
jgi:hypothetical protein